MPFTTIALGWSYQNQICRKAWLPSGSDGKWSECTWESMKRLGSCHPIQRSWYVGHALMLVVKFLKV